MYDSSEALLITAQPHDGLVRILIEPSQFLETLVANIHQPLQLRIHLCPRTIIPYLFNNCLNTVSAVLND